MKVSRKRRDLRDDVRRLNKRGKDAESPQQMSVLSRCPCVDASLRRIFLSDSVVTQDHCCGESETDRLMFPVMETESAARL